MYMCVYVCQYVYVYVYTYTYRVVMPPRCFTMFPITPMKYGPAQSQFKAIRRGFAASYWGIATARAAVCGKALVNSNPQ